MRSICCRALFIFIWFCFLNMSGSSFLWEGLITKHDCAKFSLSLLIKWILTALILDITMIATFPYRHLNL